MNHIKINSSHFIVSAFDIAYFIREKNELLDDFVQYVKQNIILSIWYNKKIKEKKSQMALLICNYEFYYFQVFYSQTMS